MKTLIFTLSILISTKSFAANCELGVSRDFPAEAAKILEDKGYNVKNIETTEHGELYLSRRNGSDRGIISGLFCTTQYQNISIIMRHHTDILIHQERISSCDNLSATIHNYEKKLAKALRKMPSCN